MAAVLYYGNDDRLPQILESFFTTRKTEAGEIHSLTKISDSKKLEEVLAGVNFEIIFIEQIILDRAPLDWLSLFGKMFPKVQSLLILVGDERDPTKILKLIEGGFMDYIVLPPDKPLIIEKFMMYANGKRSSDLRQVYSLKLSQAADLAKPGFLEELSEFDCKVRSGQATPINDMLILYAPSFSEGNSQKGSILGRCYACQEHPSFKGQYVASFYFIGVTQDLLVHIRKSLQKAYISSKNK